jgi:DNA-binding IclR family transcriptional regulator
LLIRIVARHNEKGTSLSNIARESRLHIATTHRILSTLDQEGLIHQDQGSKLYRLGIELFLLGNKAQEFHIRDQFRTPLERIARDSGDTVFLLIRSGNDALCLDRVEGQYPIRTIMFDIGSRRPLGIGVGGLALIAFLPKEVFKSIVEINAPRYAQYPRVTARDLTRMADISRKAGFVISRGYFYEGVTSIGVPVFNEREEVIAAVALSSISQRMDDQRCRSIFRMIKSVTQVEGVNFPSDQRSQR